MKVHVHAIDSYWEEHGEGEPLLWLHGGMGFGADWRHVFPEPPSGFRLIAPDPRAHGASTGDSTTLSFRQCALDVLALLRHLGIARPGDRRKRRRHRAAAHGDDRFVCGPGDGGRQRAALFSA